jgi:hypothetical protein
LGWTLPFAWAIVWTLITIPWVQSDLRREKKAWAENRGQGGIHYVDDIDAPTARTRFASVQANVWPWTRDKQSPPSTPSDGAATEKVVDGSIDGPSHEPIEAVDHASGSASNGASHMTDGTHEGLGHDSSDVKESDKSPV